MADIVRLDRAAHDARDSAHAFCISFTYPHEVYFITDASGGASREAHDMAVQRMIQAGAVPTTTWSYVSELQRDWSREATAGEVTTLFERHGGGFGQGLRWEWQLLGLKEGTR